MNRAAKLRRQSARRFCAHDDSADPDGGSGTHGLVFEPLRKRAGTPIAILTAFVASGVLHDFVISFPARGGYGLPTGYFLLQGAGVLFERSRLGRRLGIQSSFSGWLFVLICAGLPAYWLFHPPFIRNVILPFLTFIGAR
jgi:hypothetical protein